MTESIEDSSSSTDEILVDEEEINKFTQTLDQFTPVIPETVTKFYMNQCGLQTDDDRAVKLFSVSVQKFMSDIINDCFQLHKIREKQTNRAPTSGTATAPPPTTTVVPSGAGATTMLTANATTPSSNTAVGPGDIAVASPTEQLTATADQLANAAIGKKPMVVTNQTLTLTDLTHVLEDYGINVKKTFYYT